MNRTVIHTLGSCLGADEMGVEWQRVRNHVYQLCKVRKPVRAEQEGELFPDKTINLITNSSCTQLLLKCLTFLRPCGNLDQLLKSALVCVCSGAFLAD